MDEIEIRKIVQPILDEEDLFLVDVVMKGNEASQKVLVLIDGDDGLSIDQCGKVSRRLGSIIEEQDLITSRYTLEVSSPGLDFPLKSFRQYKKNIGRELTLTLDNGDQVEGRLEALEEEKLKLVMNNDQKEFPFEIIKQSKVKISFK